MTKRENRKQRRANRKAKRQERRAKFFEYKFLGVRKSLKISRTRKTIKAASIFVAAMVPAVLTVLSILAGTGFFIGLSVLSLTLAVFAPKGLAAVKERRAARFELVVERASAHKWFINMKQAKNTARMAKKHSKWSKKGAKGDAKIAKMEEKNKAKEAKRQAKEEARNKTFKDNSKFIGKLDDSKVEDIKINNV